MQKSVVIGLFVIILTCLGLGGFFLFSDSEAPQIVISQASGAIAPTKILHLTVADQQSPIKNISVKVKYNEQVISIIDKDFTGDERVQDVEFSFKDLKLNDANITLEVTATDSSFAGFGKGNIQAQNFNMHIDGIPPRLSMQTMPPNIRRGGTGVILYSASKELERTGVQVGDLFFPAFAQGDKGYLCFFAYPHFMTNSDFNPKLIAIDLAGNEQAISLQVHKMYQEFKHDTIPVTQRLLDTKDGEFSQIVPGDMSQIERFLAVNNTVRRANADKLMEIGQNTANQILWQGKFMPLPKGATRAGFADHRTYTWQDEKVDEQTHLGYDFASTTNAPVPAANSGVVIFADYLGIYGNLVVLDHGLGIQSLYSHLSHIAVSVGQDVAKGDTIGNTGTSGMAVGDHLHFGMLVSGLEVSPLEWLDSKWIQDNIAKRLTEVGFQLP